MKILVECPHCGKSQVVEADEMEIVGEEND